MILTVRCQTGMSDPRFNWKCQTKIRRECQTGFAASVRQEFAASVKQECLTYVLCGT